MKKSFLFILFISLFFLSCQKKEAAPAENPAAREFAYELFHYDLCGSFSNSKYNKVSRKAELPSGLKKLLYTPVFQNGNRLYLIEIIYPECTGEIDSYGFYSPESDNGRWVDKIVFQVQEEIIGDDITTLVESNSSVQNLLSDKNFFDDGTDGEVAVEKLLLDSEKRLKAMSYDKEIFMSYKGGKENRIIHSDGKKVSRLFYDEFYRLIKKEDWDIPDYENARKLLSVEYAYDNPLSKYPVEAIEITDTNKTVSRYSSSGVILQSDNYILENEKYKKLNSVFWDLDNDGRILSERKVDYTKKSSVTEIDSSFEKKQNFIYNKENLEIPPDYEYYEDGTIKSKTIYTDKDNYVSTVYFNNGYEVTSYYQSGKKVKDVYSVDSKVIRVKNYE